MTIGYNYLIQDTISDPHLYKIGISAVLDQRFRRLKVGELTSVIGIWSSSHYEALEKQLHKLFPKKRLPQSEWFKLNAAELAYVISQTSAQANLEFLIPEHQPASPVLTTKSVSPYVGSNPTWTDYSKPKVVNSRKVPEPLPEYIRPSEPISFNLFYFGLGSFVGFLFYIGGWLWPFIILSSSFRKNVSKEAPGLIPGFALGSLAFFLMIAANAEAKPLLNYQQPSHPNVSSLIY